MVVAALQTISDAFLLRQGDLFKLRPEDRLHDIYRAAYPNIQVPDALEFETLTKVLVHGFHVPESVLATEREPRVQDVVDWCLRYRGA